MIYIIPIMLFFLSACQGDSAPRATVAGTINPPDKSSIVEDRSIVIMFPKSMNPNSISIDGDIGDEANSAWSKDTVDNDTITISPKTVWSIADTQTLKVTATALDGASF